MSAQFRSMKSAYSSDRNYRCQVERLNTENITELNYSHVFPRRVATVHSKE